MPNNEDWGNLQTRTSEDLKSRSDGWANLLSGIGIKGRDKTAHTTYIADARLEYYELTQIYRGDGIARRIIDQPVHDMYREWFTLEGDTDGKIENTLRKLNAKKSLKRAQRFGYLYGGALAILGINDGGKYFDPVNENKIKSVEHIHVFDRWRVTLNTADLYVDPDLDKYGKPEFYNIVPIYGAPFRVHESRVLRFEGLDVSDQMRIQNQGWGDSVIQPLYNRLRGLGESYLSLENILDEFILGILTIDNLQELIANGKEALIQKRLTQIDLSKHIINSVLVDKDEKYERIHATVAGLGDLMDKLIEAASAVSGIPIPLLMGRSVAGLSDAETGQIRFYYDKIAAQQEEDARPQLEQLIRYINIAEGNPLGEEWKINFKPLWQQTQKDLIATRLIQAQIDKIYSDMVAVYPEELGNSRFGGDQYSFDTILSDAHKTELEDFSQSPKGNESAVAEQRRLEEDKTRNPDERLGVNKTTDLRTMARPIQSKGRSKYADKSESAGSGAVKDQIRKRQDSVDGVDLSGKVLNKPLSLIYFSDPFQGFIDVGKTGITSLIGLPSVVYGRVVVNGNKLKDLTGAPIYTKDFHACSCELESLSGGPQEVTDYHVHGNNLSDMRGAPSVIHKDLHAYNNKLTTMQGTPARIGGDALFNDNNITSLEGLPQFIGRNLSLKGNPITKTVTEAEIRSKCTVMGVVELDDTKHDGFNVDDLDEEQKKAMDHPDKLGEGAKKRKALPKHKRGSVVMAEFHRGTLHSGSGAKVTNIEQAKAIAASESKEDGEINDDGGAGSGNFGHGGIPGKRGGSTRAMDKKPEARKEFEHVHSIAQRFHDISEKIMSYITKENLTAEDREQLDKLHKEHQEVKQQFSSLQTA